MRTTTWGTVLLAAGIALGLLAFAPTSAAAEPSVAAEQPAAIQDSNGDDGDDASRGARYASGDEPADRAPYFYRQIGLALGVMGLMVAFLAWLIRRAKSR